MPRDGPGACFVACVVSKVSTTKYITANRIVFFASGGTGAARCMRVSLIDGVVAITTLLSDFV
jgi:hypothetical protein